jgi:HK97 family phage prohead protease
MLQKLLGPNQAKLKIVDDGADAPGGFIEGYASVFNNVDLGGDVVVPGAFKKTLKERLTRNAIKLVDSHNIHEGTSAVIGVVTDAKEDETGLWFKSRLSMVPRAQEIRTKVREGILDSTSFGYDTVKATDGADGVRYLKELKLYEVSVVIWGMNPLASINAVKSATSLPSFGLAPVEAAWDAEAATARIKAWVSDLPVEEWDEAAHSKWARAFLYTKGQDWALPVIDIVDGAPQYVFAAVKTALDDVRRDSIYKADADALEATIKSLYDRFQVEFPAKGTIVVSGAELISSLKEAASSLSTSLLIRDMTRRAEEFKALVSK